MDREMLTELHKTAVHWAATCSQLCTNHAHSCGSCQPPATVNVRRENRSTAHSSKSATRVATTARRVRLEDESARNQSPRYIAVQTQSKEVLPLIPRPALLCAGPKSLKHRRKPRAMSQKHVSRGHGVTSDHTNANHSASIRRKKWGLPGRHFLDSMLRLPLN
jgi:hypothetical protein